MSDGAAGQPTGHGFSATGAAFEGFVIAKREPKTLLAWTGVMMLFTLASGGLLLAILVPSMRSAVPTPGGVSDPSRIIGMLGVLLPLYAVTLVVGIGVYGVMYAAVNRAVLRPGPDRFGRMRLGVDELRQMGVLVAIWLGLLVAYLAMVAVIIAAAAAISVASKALGVLLGFAGGLALIAAVLYLLVRLSLLSPLAFDRRKIDVAAAWRLTRGRFWPLLGAYALAAIMCVVIVMVASTAAASLGFAIAGGAVGAQGDPSQALRAMGVVQVLNLVLTSATYGVIFALMLAAPARAYADLMQPARSAEVFGPSPTEVVSPA